jgi:uncharacterized membrane protein
VRTRRWRDTGTWGVPALYAISALSAGAVFPRIETAFFPHLTADLSVASATAIYASIASGMIALTGIVFSLTFVMVQFSATAYSPRLVLWLSRDPLISHALGVFMATFLYAITALAWVGRGAPTVPFISAMVVVVLLIASVAMFVALVQRVAFLQVSNMLAFTAAQGRAVIDSLYPPLETAPSGPKRHAVIAPPDQIHTYTGRPAAVQFVDIDALVELARRSGAVVEVLVAVGDTLFDSAPLCHVHGARRPIDDELLRGVFSLGEQRTFDQDPKYAIRLLVDIAIKALSPAVNDPTTAVQALDQIGDLLLRLSRRQLEIGAFSDQAGVVRVLIQFPLWEDFLRLAFGEIRSYGATSVQVMRRMNALIQDLTAAVPSERRGALREWSARLKSSIDSSFSIDDDRREAATPDRQGFGVSGRRPAA